MHGPLLLPTARSTFKTKLQPHQKNKNYNSITHKQSKKKKNEIEANGYQAPDPPSFSKPHFNNLKQV